jgi:hypothetical protein
VIIWQDDFNKATIGEMIAGYASRGAMDAITDGHSGQAIRFPYTSSSYDNLIEKQWDPASTDVYFRYS